MASQKVVKVPQSSWDRAESLIPVLEGKPVMAAAGDPTVAAVIRLALVLGLEQLEGGAADSAAKRQAKG